MNTKENTSMSRLKPSQTTKKTEKINMNNTEISNSNEVIKSESLNIEEAKLPQIMSDLVTIAEHDQTMNDIPKKPKRSKGKKKKELLQEHIKSEESNDNTANFEEILDNMENILEENIQVPCMRKKKKKVKKRNENIKENPDSDLAENKPTGSESVLVDVPILTDNTEIVNKDDVIAKKKKKKKRCHDSESSEKCDPCTLAFQKLIDSPNEMQVVVDDKVTEDLLQGLQEAKLNTPNPISGEKQTIKKKHNKGKIKINDLPTGEENVEGSMSEKNHENTSKDDISLIKNNENEVNTNATSSNPKAKIVKPVQKTRHKKLGSESLKAVEDHNLDIHISKHIADEVPIMQTNTVRYETFTGNEVKKENNVTLSSPQKIETDVTEIENHKSIKQETNECGDAKKLLNTLCETNKSETLVKDNDSLGLIDVKTTKGKKKRNINVTTDISESIEKKSLEIEEDTEENLHIKCTIDETITKPGEPHKVIIPDLIEYPRSTSQQHVDSNNNTFIQEITPSQEVQLETSFHIAAPISRRSGESSEAKSKTNLSKIINEPCGYINKDILQSKEIKTFEKSDIKSKMIEVNRNMEELSKSFDRSIPEKSASDIDVDKQFEELFHSQQEQQKHITVTAETKNNYNKSSVYVCKTKKDLNQIQESESLEKDIDTSEVKSTNKVEEIEIEPSGVNLGNTQLVETLNVASGRDNNEIKEIDEKEIHKVIPICPSRKDKGKNKKKVKKEAANNNISHISTTQTETSQITSNAKKDTEQKTSEQKSKSTQKTGKQQSQGNENYLDTSHNSNLDFEPIEKFEDALTTSVDDINQSFEIIAKEATQPIDSIQYNTNPQINIISPAEDTEGEKKHDSNSEIKNKQSPISRPKNLLGHPNIPASSNKTDFKKEKNKSPNSIQAKVKIKDSIEIANPATEKLHTNKNKKLIKESNEMDVTYLMKTNENLIYKYSFRKVFLPSTCHVCKKDLITRIYCNFCSLVFYCSEKHKDENWSQHQSLCFAVSTIAHLKDRVHIYADAQNISSHGYRVLRMQAILSCEKILNRKLVPWEQEALLYPRICVEMKCRQWKQQQLKDCAGCGQISYCKDHPEHVPSSHQRWCKSYALYQKLVNYQLTKGRLEPPLPTKVLNHYQMPGNINDVIGSMYNDKIEMDDVQYAALTQIATAPLTTAYCCQIYTTKLNSTSANGVKKNATFTVHIVDAELPFEADSLNKWEIFFLHLRPDVQDLRVVIVGLDINSSKLPLDLLGKIKLCENCEINKRRVIFDFHDNESYHEYYLSDAFVTPDIVCAFNPNIHRSFAYDMEKWPSTINCILKQRIPFVITCYSIEELRRDLGKVRECAKVDFNIVSEIKYNPFSSVRPDRNFINDHEMPLVFKNYNFCILCGTL